MTAFSGKHAELMGRIDALWRGGDLAAADELYAPDFTANGQRVGPDGVKEALRRLRAAFSEMRYELQEQIVAGDRFVVRWEHTGKHTGTWESPIGTLPATGKRFTISMIEIFRFEDGKAVEVWIEYETLTPLRQLGALDDATTATQQRAPNEAG